MEFLPRPADEVLKAWLPQADDFGSVLSWY